jgi:hypothetical protein
MPFNIPNQTSYVKQRPVSPRTTWVRPADWITITDTTGEVQFLVSDLAITTYAIQTTFTRTLGTQNIYIDWGDGVINTISTIGSTTTEHTYTTGGTACSLGYNTWKVRIYGDAGTAITQSTHLVPTYYSGTQIVSGLLEAYYGNNTIQTAQFLFNFSTIRPRFLNLQYAKLPSTLTSATQALHTTFASCEALAKVILPLSVPNSSENTSTFSGCRNLLEVTIPLMALHNSFLNWFNGCTALQSVTFPTQSYSAITSMSGTFLNCNNLTSVNLPDMPNCSNWNQTFSGCRSLISMEMKSFPTVASVDITSLFAGCVSLEYIKLPSSVSGGTTFTSGLLCNGCTNLKSFIFPANFNTTSLASAFVSCSSLSSCILPTSISGLTSLSSTFQNCSNLQEITLPTTVGATIDMSNTFSNCFSLSKVEIPSSYIIQQFIGTFQSCTNINNIILPNNAQNTHGSMSNTFNGCSNLVSITMPTSMNTVNTLSGTFQNCTSLTGVTLPSTMNSVTTTANMFNGCSLLRTVTLPTSMTGLVTATSMFASCTNLQSVTLPAATGLITTLNGMFNGCYALQSITLPTTQLTTLADITNAMNSNYSLTGITNQQYLGNTSTGSTIYVNATQTFNSAFNLTTLDFYTKFSKLDVVGIVTIKNKLNSLRLRNNGTGQYGGTSPQIDIRYTDLSQAALVQVFTDLPTVTSKTINITGATGAAALTAPERAIATGKGWTITG